MIVNSNPEKILLTICIQRFGFNKSASRWVYQFKPLARASLQFFHVVKNSWCLYSLTITGMHSARFLFLYLQTMVPEHSNYNAIKKCFFFWL